MYVCPDDIHNLVIVIVTVIAIVPDSGVQYIKKSEAIQEKRGKRKDHNKRQPVGKEENSEEDPSSSFQNKNSPSYRVPEIPGVVIHLLHTYLHLPIPT